MQKLPFSVLFLFLFVFMGLHSGCFLKKKDTEEKDSSFFSNLSAKYNALFNAKSLLKEAENLTQDITKDHYQTLLTVFKEPTTESIQQNLDLMNSVIEKTNFIINQKQDSKYVGEAFLLQAQAYYHRGDYYNAQELFAYVASEESNASTLVHEAQLWQIRCMLRLDNLKEAEQLLNLVAAKVGENKYLKAFSAAVQASYSLQIKNKASAISQLNQAIENSPNKEERLRWNYLTGQLLFEKEEYDLASPFFAKVVKSNVSYAMAFHAQLYLVAIQNQSNPGLENKTTQLTKLLKEGKNKPFKGQIYQRIGDAYQEENQLEKAILNYSLASQHTHNDPFQKAINYERLADLYFKEAQYSYAKTYYDSTLNVLNPNDDRYLLLSKKHSHLDSLVQELREIAYQDTLLELAEMSPEARELTLEKLRQKLEKTQVAEARIKQNIPKERSSPLTESTETNIGFYFTSPTAISQGMSSFKSRWGQRVPGTYWRYADQKQLSTGTTPLLEIAQESPLQKEDPFGLNERYLEPLPDTPEKKENAHRSIKNSLLKLGALYQYELQDPSSATETYLDYLNRFPKDEQTALLYFYLYRLQKDSTSLLAKEFKQKLGSEYPQSEYYLSIIDPEYYQNQRSAINHFNARYEALFTQFQNREYEPAIQQANLLMSDKEFLLLHSQMAQTAYLRALSIGYIRPLNEFTTALEELIKAYPGDNLITPLSQQHLQYISDHFSQFEGREFALIPQSGIPAYQERDFTLTPWPEFPFLTTEEERTARRTYGESVGQIGISQDIDITSLTAINGKNIQTRTLPEIRHENGYIQDTVFPDTATYYYVIQISHGDVNLSPSRFAIGQFNRNYYANSNLRHQLKILEEEEQLLFIGNFSTFAEASAYQKNIDNQLENLMKIPPQLYKGFLVTEEVFNTFANSAQVEEYYSLYLNR